MNGGVQLVRGWQGNDRTQSVDGGRGGVKTMHEKKGDFLEGGLDAAGEGCVLGQGVKKLMAKCGFDGLGKAFNEAIGLLMVRGVGGVGDVEGGKEGREVWLA